MPYSNLAETDRSSLGDPDSPPAAQIQTVTYNPDTAQTCTHTLAAFNHHTENIRR